MWKLPNVAALLALGSLGCGAAAPAPTTARPGAGALDWALLVPLETDALLRVDLSRARRSPHRESLVPVLEDVVVNAADPGMRSSLGALLERTDEVLIALVPSGMPSVEEDVLVLARGRFGADELERLGRGTPAGSTEALDLEGHQVRAELDGLDTIAALAQVRRDTMVLTGSVEPMQRLLSRLRMEGGSPRWPPAVRALVEASGMERATFGLVMANRTIGAYEGEVMPMSMASWADADGPLDIRIVMELGDPTLAAAAAVFVTALVDELGQEVEGEAFALAELAELARIEASGTQVRGSIHAERATADQLVPGLMGLLRDGLTGDALPPLGQELPTPI